MSVPSHIRRIVAIAVVGCAILAGWSSAAAARPIDDPTLHTTSAAASTAEPSPSAARERGNSTLPFVLAGAVVVLVVGAVAYSYRARTSRRVTA
jgi:hypothetical protein